MYQNMNSTIGFHPQSLHHCCRFGVEIQVEKKYVIGQGWDFFSYIFSNIVLKTSLKLSKTNR